VTANFDEDEKMREVFVNMGHTGSQEKSYTEAIGRLISRYLQLNGSIKAVIDSMKGIKSDAISWDRGLKLYSVPDAIAKSLEMTLGTGTSNLKATPLSEQEKLAETESGPQVSGYQLSVKTSAAETCPECSEVTLVYEGGCYTCKNCGYTKCA
jgi:ribonucleoside-diphosphate reductase alpha chain